MTPEQITLVQASYQRLGPRLPDMAARFYQELFRRDPALRSLFTIDLAEQQVRFAHKLTELVEAIPRLDELLAHTRALGARHVGYGVRAADYQTVGAALFDALAAVLGDGFDPETRQAWVLAYNLMSETMLDGAASARPVG
jgi:methyl-accepting chemotaxis protein